MGSSSTSNSASEASGGDEGHLLAVALGIGPRPLGRIEKTLDQLIASVLVDAAAQIAEDVDDLAAGELEPQLVSPGT